MKEIFHKAAFPTASGGNIYHWQEADTTFGVSENGYYVIAITASANNAAQKKSTDDDDLRAVIDDYEFGKHEAHQAKISWRGFGTAASWDGASLKGGTKTVYFFVALEKGNHVVKFWADEKPTVHEITVSQIEENAGAIEDAIFEFGEKAPGIPTDTKGIPWKAFVFTRDFSTTNLSIRLVDIQATCRSAKQQGGTDGDNIRVYLNGQIVHNPKAPTSDKYKNFFFSGDLSQGKSEALMLDWRTLLLGDQDFSLEFWYDETPVLEHIKFELIGKSQYDRTKYYENLFAQLSEAKGLPFKLLDNLPSIRRISNDSLGMANQYAAEHDFEKLEDNEPDAFRHFIWNVRLTREFDAKSANIITAHHEIFWMKVNHKRELPRAGVMDLWNNLKGREYVTRYPEKGEMELFKMAVSDSALILALDDVTEQHREKTQEIINDVQNGS